MVKKIIFYFSFLSLNAFAIDGVIKVLEAPLFHEPDSTSKVIQYQRKGDIIYIRPEDSENKNDRFYKTVDKLGRVSYIEKRFVTTDYLEENLNEEDPTDYRIEEPLPPHYPFYLKKPNRGSIALGISKPTDSPYPMGKMRDSTSNYGLELWGAFAKEVISKENSRLFWGITGLFETYENTYLNHAGQSIVEKTNRLGIGPEINYDLWTRPKYTMNIGAGALLNFYYNKKITKNDKLQNYSSYYFTPFISYKFIKKEIAESASFILGTNAKFELPHQMKSEDDSYDQKLSLSFDLIFGLQMNY